jgi:glc operon protein GlcG
MRNGSCICVLVGICLAGLPVSNAQQPPTDSAHSDVALNLLPYGAPVTHDQVMGMVAAMHGEAKKRDVDALATIVIVDPNGEIVYAEKATNARNSWIDIAWAKARSSARYGAPSEAFYDMLVKGNLAQSLALPGVASMGIGGIPIVWQGHIIGGVGVSGAFGDNDVAIAEAGVASLKK